LWHNLCLDILQEDNTDKNNSDNKTKWGKIMLSEQKTIEEQVATLAGHTELTDVEIGNSRFGIITIMAMAGFVGVWGFVCLLNGIAQSQNIQELGRGIFTALTGI
jgi:hypothetical protein